MTRPIDVSAFDQGSDLIDLGALIAILRRRLWTLLSSSLLVFLLVVLVTLQLTPRYTATAQVAIEVRQSQVIDFEAVMSGLPPDSAAVDTEVEILRSRQLAGAVVDRLGLVAHPEFNPTLRTPGLLDRLKSAARGLVSALVPANAAPGPDTGEAARDSAVAALLEATSVRRAGLTYVINITATSESPALARDIANAYADQYIVSQLEAKYAATERANEWLNERVDSLRDQVRAREAAVAQFRNEAGLLDAEGATLTEQQITDVNAQLVLQRAELAEAEARLRTLRQQLDRGASADSISEVLRSDVIRDLRSQQAEISRRRGELSSRYGPRHPQILTVERELADVAEQIDLEIQRIVNNLDNDVDVARERVRSLESSLATLRDELAENYSALVRLRELEREAEASRTLFESILARFQQTSEQQSLTESDARIVSTAAQPRAPSSPKVLLNLALGLVLGALVGVGLVALLEVFDTGVHSGGDVELKLGQAHIASVPRIQSGLMSSLSRKTVSPPKYISDKPLSGFAESFRNIRSAIRLNAMDAPIKTVAVTSAVPGEGKTTVTACLGQIAALADSRVLVMDCDLRRRLLTLEIAPDAEVGLLQVLSSDVALSDAIQHVEATGLDVLPLSASQFTPKDVFGSAAFAELLRSVRDQYDLILLDTAPVLAVADTPAIVSQVDATICAVRWRKTPVSLSRMALSALDAAKARVLGVVLNNVDLKAQARYGYGGGYYGYYQAYQKYYSQ
ncbi:polysaccharide biosynthesis tyrosine autokinase [Maricaulis parjimensis]|uniref:polysaccharide biosynthesis tyrosine autokinase n=1 Tax=Maricaulis parjimensis TaxID=144023 RepID=UPI001939F1F3|nr:polysaccharide biosynthesis tyrosine autokinase [Maricaulis parjimensis]